MADKIQTDIGDLAMDDIVRKMRARLEKKEQHSLVNFINHQDTTLEDLKKLERILSPKDPLRMHKFFIQIEETSTLPEEELAYLYHGRIRVMYITALLRQIYQLTKSGYYAEKEGVFERQISTLSGICNSATYPTPEKLIVFVKEILSNATDVFHFCRLFNDAVFSQIRCGKKYYGGYVAFVRKELSTRMYSEVLQDNYSPHNMALFSIGALTQIKARYDRGGTRTEEMFKQELISLYSLFRRYKEENINFPFRQMDVAISGCIKGFPEVEKGVHWFTVVSAIWVNIEKPLLVQRSTIQYFLEKLQKLFSFQCSIDWEEIEILNHRTEKNHFYEVCRKSVLIIM